MKRMSQSSDSEVFESADEIDEMVVEQISKKSLQQQQQQPPQQKPSQQKQQQQQQQSSQQKKKQTNKKNENDNDVVDVDDVDQQNATWSPSQKTTSRKSIFVDPNEYTSLAATEEMQSKIKALNVIHINSLVKEITKQLKNTENLIFDKILSDVKQSENVLQKSSKEAKSTLTPGLGVNQSTVESATKPPPPPPLNQTKPMDETMMNSQTDGWDSGEWEDIDNDDEDNETKKKSKRLADDMNDGWEFDEWDNDETTEHENDKKMDVDQLAKTKLDNVSVLKKSQNSSIDEKMDIMENVNEKDKDSFSGLMDVAGGNSSSSSSWAAWKPWDNVVQLLTTAGTGVASLTSHVSQAIESGIGVPDPEEMAKLQRNQNSRKSEKSIADAQSTNSDGSSIKDQTIIINDDSKSQMMLGNLVSNVQNIGSKVITGGLDTLEGIGKKTMTILQENDPGLLHKRNQNIVLSQVLREAKESSEAQEKYLKQVRKSKYRKRLNFEKLFDDYHGLVHLEALEMLSQESSMKLDKLKSSLVGRALTDLEEMSEQIKEICDLNEMDNTDDDDDDDVNGLYTANDLNEKFIKSIQDLNIPIDFRDILNCWTENVNWIETENNSDNKTKLDDSENSQTIYDKALCCLAKTSALAVNKMHKLAELLILVENHSTVNEADSLVQLTTVFCWHLNGIATRFGNMLNNKKDMEQDMENDDDDDENEDTHSFITNIFLESSKSVSYIQKAFELFIPILQLGAA